MRGAEETEIWPTRADQGRQAALEYGASVILAITPDGENHTVKENRRREIIKKYYQGPVC